MTEYDKVYKIISNTNDMLCDGKFEEIDEIIDNLDMPNISTSELIAWATATYWHGATKDGYCNDVLKNRRPMMEKISRELRSRPDWDDMHLYGLEGK